MWQKFVKDKNLTAAIEQIAAKSEIDLNACNQDEIISLEAMAIIESEKIETY